LNVNLKNNEDWLNAMKATLRLRCPNCGQWNNIEAEKVMLDLDNQEPKMTVYMPAYLPLKTEVCSKCKTVIANQKELIRIIKD
jgi:hypothetical protein